MEAVRDFTACEDEQRGTDRGAAPVRQPGMDAALAALRAVSSTAVEDSGSWGFRTASDFAGSVEEISRTMEYLQLVAAAAVDRTRKQSAAAASGVAAGAVTTWTTGWRESPAGWQTGTPGTAEPAGASLSPAPSGTSVAAAPSGRSVAAAPAGTPGTVEPAVPESVLDDGYRNTVEFLRARLRIGAAEAKRRLCLADTVLPRQGLDGRPMPPAHPELGAAVAAGEVASRAATVITLALDRVRHSCLPEAAAAMEHALTRAAAETDADFLARVSRSWAEALYQDGAEPSEELLRQLQGAFLRKPRHGLQHLEIFATTDQFEHLTTVMNTATNPRTSSTAQAGPGDAEFTDPDAGTGGGTAADSAAGVGAETVATASLDLRSRPQKLLDGLVGACKAALATGGLPAAGGLRPQVMATIDYRDLLTRLGETAGATATTGKPGTGTGTLLFTGPVTADTIRKIACDADIIPVVLGGDGQVLDIGRASRVFPPHVRKALTARDRGCAFPQCTIPAPWCEAHHITYWSQGGSTGTDNGTLLCSHHHHLIHKEQWTVQLRTGIPWFIPPPHVDPAQTPRRNSYFRPVDPVAAARQGAA
ncbi:protein of unknown function [Arthrobacter sp. ov407]|uniref:HNH endonuclease signature motif containing protein n=1 Tax=Arthrobacter sp. ov407 TaxID=1761748 RepID=UPI00088DDB4B|nr:HNH endonuclease signature motif containing protein [Arthrobacter sp. ov407]SDL76706.1 protein of unknown function [Arthrobacter sp. ov407]